MDLLVVGRGRLGRSLARALTEAGNRVELVPGRELPERQPAAELAFLAVSDAALRQVANAVARALPRSTPIVHVSGSLPLGELAAAAELGHPTGSFHPFQSFPFERPPEAFAGSLIAIDADGEELLEKLDRLAAELGGRPRRVPDRERALYHVAAVLSSNLVLGLVSSSARVLEAAGWSRLDAVAAITPLLAGVVSNLSAAGLEGALIGPIRRGDPETVRRHLRELDARGLEEIAGLYRMLGGATLELALAAGLDPAAGEQIRVALTGEPAATGGAEK